MGHAKLGGVRLSGGKMVDGALVKIVLQAALDRVAAGLFDDAAPGDDVVKRDTEGFHHFFRAQLAERAVLLDDDLDGVLVGNDVFQAGVAGGVHKLLREEHVHEIVAEGAGDAGDLGASAVVVFVGAELIAPLRRAGVGHDELALLTGVDDDGGADAAGGRGGDVDGGAGGQNLQHDGLQSSGVVVSAGADFLRGKG